LTSALTFLHGYGARALLIWSIVLGAWGTIQYFRNRPLSGGFRSSYLIAAGLTALQGLIGLANFVLGLHPTTLLHFVYGIFAVVFLPGAYLYSRSGSKRLEAVVLAGASWIVSIAFFRGIATG
jgi:CDP-diglyceride synthetase